MIGIPESRSLLRRARTEHPELDLRVVETNQELIAAVLTMLHELDAQQPHRLPAVLSALHADFFVQQATRRHLEALTMLLDSVVRDDAPSTSKEV